jgi:hypothetical protein
MAPLDQRVLQRPRDLAAREDTRRSFGELRDLGVEFLVTASCPRESVVCSAHSAGVPVTLPHL